jgi:hypothetical protein
MDPEHREPGHARGHKRYGNGDRHFARPVRCRKLPCFDGQSRWHVSHRSARQLFTKYRAREPALDLSSSRATASRATQHGPLGNMRERGVRSLIAYCLNDFKRNGPRWFGSGVHAQGIEVKKWHPRVLSVPPFPRIPPNCSRMTILVSDRDGIGAIVMRGGNTPRKK